MKTHDASNKARPYLHAGVVHNHLVMHDVWEAVGDLSDTLKKETVRFLHDVSLVYSGYSLAIIIFSILECILCDAYGCFPGYHLHKQVLLA
jgi:hypothetical protein